MPVPQKTPRDPLKVIRHVHRWSNPISTVPFHSEVSSPPLCLHKPVPCTNARVFDVRDYPFLVIPHWYKGATTSELSIKSSTLSTAISTGWRWRHGWPLHLLYCSNVSHSFPFVIILKRLKTYSTYTENFYKKEDLILINNFATFLLASHFWHQNVTDSDRRMQRDRRGSGPHKQWIRLRMQGVV